MALMIKKNNKKKHYSRRLEKTGVKEQSKNGRRLRWISFCIFFQACGHTAFIKYRYLLMNFKKDG